MKSYFAKLAARATLANAPTVLPVAASNTHDPFEETSTYDRTVSPAGAAPSEVRSDASVNPTPHRAFSDDEGVRTRRKESPANVSEEHDELRETVVTRVEARPIARSSSDLTENSQTQETISRLQPRDSKFESTESTQSAPNDTSEFRLAPPSVSERTVESRAVSEPGNDEVLEEMKREQSALLRKADTFMASLLERRPGVAGQEPVLKDTSQESISKPASPRAGPTRLQPPPGSPHVREAAQPDQPSLVIGKLTVEVAPPPQPIAPSPQVVVIRESRSTRRAGIPSSQRFGLGQF
jgi:hypothetical protein